jgi:hypothetical protein
MTEGPHRIRRNASIPAPVHHVALSVNARTIIVGDKPEIKKARTATERELD